MPGYLPKTALGVITGLFCALAGCDSAPGGDAVEANPAGRLLASDVVQPQAECVVSEESDELADQLLRLVNRARFEAGAVTLDEELTGFAEAYACTMITEDFFGHTHPTTGVGLAERAMASEYNYLAVGENLAAGIAAPEDVAEAWLGSAAHREIMLDSAFTRTGIAVRYGGENEVYWVQVFADPAD